MINFSPINHEMCILPVCFRPTTVMLVDDDPDFLHQVALQVSEHIPVITFTNPDDAIRYFESQNLMLQRWMSGKNKEIDDPISHLRKEMYNNDRFNVILVSVVDYAMPNKTGFDIMNTMGEPILSEMAFHSYILFTGKKISDLDHRLSSLVAGNRFVSKWDPDRIEHLLSSIQTHSAQTFQWMSYPIARKLSEDPNERTHVLLDGNFLNIFNTHIQENNICELYLFDRQGSYVFLDDRASISWLLVRNDLGMAKSIALAQKYKAPEWVIRALTSREKLLSLYEEADFSQLTDINWEACLLDAGVFESDDKYTKFFKLAPQTYYYAFTTHIPGHERLTERVLSYKKYIENRET